MSCLVAGRVFVLCGRLGSVPRLLVPAAQKVGVCTKQKASAITKDADLSVREKLVAREKLARCLMTLNS